MVPAVKANAEVTFSGYNERQAHYAQMKRPATLKSVWFSWCLSPNSWTHQMVNFHFWYMMYILYVRNILYYMRSFLLIINSLIPLQFDFMGPNACKAAGRSRSVRDPQWDSWDMEACCSDPKQGSKESSISVLPSFWKRLVKASWFNIIQACVLPHAILTLASSNYPPKSEAVDQVLQVPDWQDCWAITIWSMPHVATCSWCRWCSG